ncbi:MAG: GNAT family N-acetyltransferase [Burkholderiales bacterium]
MQTVPEFAATERLKDGSAVTIRVMNPDDKERLVEAFLKLQPQTVRMRFLYAKKHLCEGELRWLGKIGLGRHFGLVATVPTGNGEVIVAEGSNVATGDAAEIGFTVADAWQGRGIASRLLGHLARNARAQGVRRFEADVLRGNAPMLAVFRHSGLAMTTAEAEGALRVTLALESAAPRH